MMRILWICGLPLEVQQYVSPDQFLGAQASWSWVLGHLPSPEKVDLHIACPVKGRHIGEIQAVEYQGATFHLVSLPRGRLQTGFILDRFFFRKLFKQLEPDIVHGWGTEDAYSIVAQSLAPKNSVVQVQGLINACMQFGTASWGMKYIAMRERKTLQCAPNVFVESAFSGTLAQQYGAEATAIKRVDHPLRREFLSAPISIENSSRRILFVGTIIDRKGIYDALQAFADSNLAADGWVFCIAGSGSGAAVERLESLIRDLGIERGVECLGQVGSSELIQQMKNSSIFLLPSYIDTGPTALKEAVAMGLWPVCYGNSGPKELIERFGYGSLAETGNVESLTKKLGEAARQSPWGNSLLRKTVTQRIRRELSLETVWKKLCEEYSAVCGG